MPNLSKSELARQILMLVFSILAMLVLLGYGVYSLVTSILNFDPQDPSILASGVLGLVSTLTGVALLSPMLVHSVKRLSGKDIRTWEVPPVKWQAVLVFIVWVVCVLLAGGFNSLFDYGWVISLPFFVAAGILPVALLAWVAIGGLTNGSQRRLWAVLGLSMGGSTVLAILAEYLVIGVIAVVIGVVSYAKPEVKTLIDTLREQISSGMDVEALLPLLGPYVAKPWIYLTLLALAAVSGPMIEEAVKPAALWLLGKNFRSPAEGFALGALSGAGFALLEGLMASSGAVTMLGFGLAARFTSTLMHIIASGLVGWGIASARLEKRYGRMIGAYLLACTIHGLWNGSVVTVVYGSLRVAVLGITNVDVVGIVAIVLGLGILGMLFLSILVFLPLLNWQMRRGLPALVTPAGNDIIAPLTTQPERTSDGLDSQSS